MADEHTRRTSDNNWIGRAKGVAELINTLGLAVFLSAAVVVGGFGWFVGWWPTPWVTPKDFAEFNLRYQAVHESQNALHTELLTEAKKQTKILRLTRCDNLSTMGEQRQCNRGVNEDR